MRVGVRVRVRGRVRGRVGVRVRVRGRVWVRLRVRVEGPTTTTTIPAREKAESSKVYLPHRVPG